MEVRDSNPQSIPDFTGPSASVTALIQNITSSMSVFGYNDEYDPLKPNDYEKLKEQQKREQIQRDRELESQRPEESEPKRGLYDDYDEEEEKQFHDRPSRKGNVFAPPPSLIEEDKRASTTSHTTESGIYFTD